MSLFTAYHPLPDTEPEAREEDMNQSSQSDSVMTANPKKTQSIKRKRTEQGSLYLNAFREHTIWKPQCQERRLSGGCVDVSENRQDLLDRKKRLQYRVIATQEVLKVQREELEDIEEVEELGGVHRSMPKEQRRWHKAIKKVMENNTKVKSKRKCLQFHDSVTQRVVMMSESSYKDSAESRDTSANEEAPSSRDRRTVPIQSRKRILKTFLSESNIPIV